ncbi:hypothetical protein ACLM5J_09705 [Nocardioides sp. Bht2]|uniref:hypothetical protein n=1 Tax=Nocardioides sp. Bht2 TaxID=3392297 RepID=UPI0039B4FE25
MTISTSSPMTWALSPAMNVAFPVGAFVRAIEPGGRYVTGDVTAATTTSVTIAPDVTSGSGSTFSSWTIVVAGIRGAQGALGATGSTGSQGPTGLQGPTGPQGATGAKGDAGATGATGPQGLTPELRATSTAAVTIWSSTPTTWTLSPAIGVPFPVGSRIVASVVGSTRFSGGIVTASSTTSVTISPDEVSGNGTSASDWVLAIAGYRGPTGPQGATGAKGDQGIQGATGVTGGVGATGAQGPTGLQGIQGPTGSPGATGATGPTVIVGTSGKQYRLISGVLRNSGSGWAWINDAGHVPTGVTLTVSPTTNAIVINFNATASKVSSLHVTPDETLAAMGVRAGSSVGFSTATIQLFTEDQYSINDFVQYSAGAWSSFNNVFSGFSYSAGSLILTHEDMGTTYNFGASIANRGPTLAQVNALSATTTQIQFYTGAFGSLTLASTANTNMRFYLTRHGRRAVTPPADPASIVAANGNLWVTGYMEV